MGSRRDFRGIKRVRRRRDDPGVPARVPLRAAVDRTSISISPSAGHPISTQSDSFWPKSVKAVLQSRWSRRVAPCSRSLETSISIIALAGRSGSRPENTLDGVHICSLASRTDREFLAEIREKCARRPGPFHSALTKACAENASPIKI